MINKSVFMQIILHEESYEFITRRLQVGNEKFFTKKKELLSELLLSQRLLL